jgi:trigger factor
MNVEVTNLPESRATLKIELSPEEVGEALERTHKQLVRRVNVPGFRKGKAPRAMVERAVGHELFIHEATEEAVRWGYRKAIDQEKLDPIDEAEIEPDEQHDHLEEGQPFTFEATVPVKPEVQLPDYHAIHLDRPEVQVSDEDVDQLLQDLRERNATLEPVLRNAQIADVVTMNVTGKADGHEVITNENLDFELRDEEAGDPDPSLPGLAKELQGVKQGDIREITLPLPDLYRDEELAGKTLFLRVLVKEIKRKVLPELDDEFAQSISELETLEAVRDTLRKNLTVERRLEAEEKLVADAINEVTSKTSVEIPPVLIEEEIDRMLSDMRSSFARRGLDFQQYLNAAGKSEIEIRDEMREGAKQNVTNTLVLAAVADAENIQTPSSDVNRALEELLKSSNMAQGERRRLRSSNAVRSNIKSRLRRQQAIAQLLKIVAGPDELSSETAEAAAEGSTSKTDVEETATVEVGG